MRVRCQQCPWMATRSRKSTGITVILTPGRAESYAHNAGWPDTPTFAAADEISFLEGDEARQRTEERYKRSPCNVSPEPASLPTTAKEQEPEHRSAAQLTSKSRRHTLPSGEVRFVIAASKT